MLEVSINSSMSVNFTFARADGSGDGFVGEYESGGHAIDIIASDRGGVGTAVIIIKRIGTCVPRGYITKHLRSDLSSGVEIMTIIDHCC